MGHPDSAPDLGNDLTSDRKLTPGIDLRKWNGPTPTSAKLEKNLPYWHGMHLMADIKKLDTETTSAMTLEMNSEWADSDIDFKK